MVLSGQIYLRISGCRGARTRLGNGRGARFPAACVGLGAARLVNHGVDLANLPDNQLPSWRVGPKEVIVFRRKQFKDGAIFDLRMMFLALKTLF